MFVELYELYGRQGSVGKTKSKTYSNKLERHHFDIK